MLCRLVELFKCLLKIDKAYTKDEQLDGMAFSQMKMKMYFYAVAVTAAVVVITITVPIHPIYPNIKYELHTND